MTHDAPMRPLPVVPGDLVRGINAGDARVTSGVEFARPDGHPLTLTIIGQHPPGAFRSSFRFMVAPGCAEHQTTTALFARYFASRGHVVFAIDYRHAPRWRWPAQILDVRSALAWIRTHAAEYDGDASRLVLLGRSAGAQLALIAAYEGTPADVVGVVSFYGPTDLVEGWRSPRPDPFDVRAVLETYLGGTPDQVPEPYRAASPLTYVSAKVPPTLLLYGSRDHIVEAQFGRMLNDRLRAAGATSFLLELPWSEHAFDALPNGLGGQVSLYYVERFLAGSFVGDPSTSLYCAGVGGGACSSTRNRLSGSRTIATFVVAPPRPGRLTAVPPVETTAPPLRVTAAIAASTSRTCS